jgi:D-beta-D-heptose 7-phosphate kinase / D-beta-D-heptose 1-phosphate adenosyltransferase
MERRQSKVKVWVNGTFDVMHVGHIKLLEHASSLGIVRVGLDTDERIKEKKGSNRPVNTLQDRIDFMKSIKYVDSVVSFGSSKELEQRIQEWDADVMVIGDDYEYHEIIGNHLVNRISFFDKVKNKSTTKILNHATNSSR